jgi:hypothetical protein
MTNTTSTAKQKNRRIRAVVGLDRIMSALLTPLPTRMDSRIHSQKKKLFLSRWRIN